MSGIFPRRHTATTAPEMPPQVQTPSPPVTEEATTQVSQPLAFDRSTERIAMPGETGERYVAEELLVGDEVPIGPTGRPMPVFPTHGR